MADGVKISLLPGAGTISDTDVVAGVQAGSTKKFSFAAIFAWLKAKLTPGEIGAQEEITASGILMGDGQGGVTAAQAGTDYATPNQIPLVPSASVANPQMDGTASPGSTGEWADGGHVHPTDTTRAAAALEINGHHLTGNFDLTAADVGALASDGTAAAARTLAIAHSISGPAGWYRFLEIPCSAGQSRSVDLLITDSFSYRSAILRIYITRSSAITSVIVSVMAGTIQASSIKWKYATNLQVYVQKASSSDGVLQFRELASAGRTGAQLDLDGWWMNDSVTEPTAATATTATLHFSAVAVSAGVNQQILQVLDEAVTENHILAGITFADPAYITGSGSWASAAGSFTLTGTATAATTADVLLVRKGN